MKSSSTIYSIFIFLAGGIIYWLYDDVRIYKAKYQQAQSRVDSFISNKKPVTGSTLSYTINAAYIGEDTISAIGKILPDDWCNNIDKKIILNTIKKEKYVTLETPYDNPDAKEIIFYYNCFSVRFIKYKMIPFKQEEKYSLFEIRGMDGKHLVSTVDYDFQGQVVQILIKKYNF